ncbi:MAG: HAD family hydrolase [Lachnospiraceae bacterium]|nr:HAD family hydrolase [Lachnospiraceae bacterium]MDE6185718.1 HAD family hydrolase [Lachnospiraceae bacterium]
MKYRHIVFDIDGTLIDNEKAIIYSLQEALHKETGKQFSYEQLTFALGIPGEDALERLKVGQIAKVMQVWIKDMQKYEDTIVVYEGIAELLKHLSEAGYGLGIVSSRTREMYKQDFCKWEISSYFATAVCADDTSGHKPTADPLLKYMELTKTAAHEIIFIGDSIHDSQCAQNAGVDFGLAVWGSHTQSIPANYYLNRPEELFSAIKASND